MSSYWLKLQQARYPLRLGETLLGRSPYCSIILGSAEVSRQHAALRVTREGVQIEDLESRNGTWVNRRRIAGSLTVAPGDRIEIGGHFMEIEPELRDDQAQRQSLAITGEYSLPAEFDHASEELTEPRLLPPEQRR